MIIKGICVTLVYLCLYVLYFVKCEAKSSLVFVIDDTPSMTDDIRQVKEKTHEVFDAVLSSNGSVIDDFVLVTFNDPGTILHVITRDKYEYKRAVEAINIHGGSPDCPELAMTGIELGLQNSKPNSFLYVFTDASAKDYYLYERVKSLSLKKNIQVTFLLTGICDTTYSPEYVVYNNLAQATSGQVFNLQKDDLSKVINYIISCIKHKSTTLGTKSFGRGAENRLKFTVDSKIWDIKISITSTESVPHYRAIDSDNVEIPTEDIARTAKSSMFKLKAKPGIYTIILNGNYPASVVVTGSTTVSFQHGFSPVLPTSINETSSKPIIDQPSFLSIELDNKDKDIKLETAEIRDEHDNYINELPLESIDEAHQFYTTESFIPPNIPFKIAVNGYTPSKEKITRVSPTTIEFQKPALDPTKNLMPTVTILADSNIDVEYNKPVTIKCKVKGYPKPNIFWINQAGDILPSTVNAIDLPYDYMSILNVNKATKNETFVCKASNSFGQDYKSIYVNILAFFNVLAYPKDTIIEYEKTANFNLKIDASLPTSILWYKDDTIISEDENFRLSSDKSTLTIDYMDPKLVGNYVVEAYNDLEKKIFKFKIYISGTERPVINKTIDNYHVESGSGIDLHCSIIKGKPRPTLTWSIDREYSGAFEALAVDDSHKNKGSYDINDVGLQDGGLYRCIARNYLGEDTHDMDLFVEYAPEIEWDADRSLIVMEGELVQLPCTVYGAPRPSVRWLFDRVEITPSYKYQIYKDNTLSFRTSFPDSGNYTCEASNPLGKKSQSIHIEIAVPVKIESPEKNFELKVGSKLVLPCKADGYPIPEVKWIFYSANADYAPRTLNSDVLHSNVVVKGIQLHHEGFYTCVASNKLSSDNITYAVKVTAPATIVNTLKNKNLKAVDGDLALRIRCKAIGSPKPAVTWMTGGNNIPSGTEWYDIEDDGTLIIKNIEPGSAGSYICKAENTGGSAYEDYTVTVLDYPIIDHASVLTKQLIKNGSSRALECGPHYKTDRIRWFKDGRFIKTGELILHNVKLSDSGIYTCRVSNFMKSYSIHKKLVVGYKPAFTELYEDTNIAFIEYSVAALSCDAIGEPRPEVHWWKEYKRIEENDMYYIFYSMTTEDVGKYKCELRNEFGSISRTFNVIKKGCVINSDSFDLYQPLILSEELKWIQYQSIDGLIQLETSHQILLVCPDSFLTITDYNLKKKTEIATCVEGSIFDINGMNVDISDVKCDKKVTPLTKTSGKSCGQGHTELLSIGFNIHRFNLFLNVYDVCIDRDNNVPLWARHDMHPSEEAISKDKISFMTTGSLKLNFKDMYDCGKQQRSIYMSTGKQLSPDHRCCFAKRRLVNPKDVAPGHPQVATYHYYNVLPKWGTCGTEHWDEVEERVRALASSSTSPLRVWTGGTDAMYLPTQPLRNPVHLTDRFDKKQPVPHYFWKVIKSENRDPVAIVQINTPGISTHQAISQMRCRYICDEIDWMRGTEWRDVRKGFTFCCHLKEFERAFGYKGTFVDGMDTKFIPRNAVRRVNKL